MLSYAITVCNESAELFNLLTFLSTIKRSDDEIVVLVDVKNSTDGVYDVLSSFKNINVFEKEFNNDFAEHKNYLNTLCKGEYVFNIDADEIPQEFLVKTVEKLTDAGENDLIWIPRINICPGYTQEFIKRHNFNCNEFGWINWPDYQGRVYRRGLKWGGKVHEKITDADRALGIKPTPQLALWHIKSVSKQDRQNILYDCIS